MTAADQATVPVTVKLSTLDRYLAVWIGLAMATGLLVGRAIPDLDHTLDAVKVDTVSLPIAIGLLAMMYPVLAKVRYRRIGAEATRDRAAAVTLAFNWLVGPLLMFTLAWVFLADVPELRTGLIIVGIAPCIAMVLIWNDLAGGNRELAAALVAFNSLIQIALFATYGWFLLTVLPSWLGLDTADLDVSMWAIAKSVLIFLGIPLVAGFLTRTVGEARKGTDWYEQRFLPRVGPSALYGLLFTIVVLFALQGSRITGHPLDVARVAVPLLMYFGIMWGGSFALGYRLWLPYERNASVAFTAAGNNFELAIAVSIAVFGVTSGQALAGTARSSRSPPSSLSSTSPCGPNDASTTPTPYPGPPTTPSPGGACDLRRDPRTGQAYYADAADRRERGVHPDRVRGDGRQSTAAAGAGAVAGRLARRGDQGRPCGIAALSRGDASHGFRRRAARRAPHRRLLLGPALPASHRDDPRVRSDRRRAAGPTRAAPGRGPPPRDGAGETVADATADGPGVVVLSPDGDVEATTWRPPDGTRSSRRSTRRARAARIRSRSDRTSGRARSASSRVAVGWSPWPGGTTGPSPRSTSGPEGRRVRRLRPSAPAATRPAPAAAPPGRDPRWRPVLHRPGPTGPAAHQRRSERAARASAGSGQNVAMIDPLDAAAPRVYLAGPDVFLPDALEVGAAKQRLCAEVGLTGVFPLDGPYERLGGLSPSEAGLAAFDICVELMDTCALAVANMTPFRGPSMDVGTAVEMGYMYAQGKPVFGYSNTSGVYSDRVSPDEMFVEPSVSARS